MKKILIVELAGYQGDDTELRVTPDPLFMVVDAVTGEDLDNGYRSFDEAVKAWKDHFIINIDPENPWKAKSQSFSSKAKLPHLEYCAEVLEENYELETKMFRDESEVILYAREKEMKKE